MLNRCAWQPGNQQLTNKFLVTLTINASGAHGVKLAAEKSTCWKHTNLKRQSRLVCSTTCVGDAGEILLLCTDITNTEGTTHMKGIDFLHVCSVGPRAVYIHVYSTLWSSCCPMLRSTRPNRNFGRSRNLGKPGVKGQLVDFNNQNLSCGGFWLGWLMVCVLYSKIISELFGQVIEADFSRMEAETTASEASRLDPNRLFSNDTCWTQAMLTCFEVPAPLLHVGFHFFL